MASIILANITTDTPPGSVIGPGDSVVFTLEPGLLVNVVGSPQLALSNGEVANFIGTDANGNPQFRYTVAAGDDTSDLQVLSLGLNGGTITLLGLPITLNLGLGTDTGIAVDTVAPATPAAPTLTTASDTGASSTDGITSDATPTFTGTAEAGSTVTLFDGTTQVGTATVASNGTYSVTASNLADGDHALHVTATDVAGNMSASSGDVSVTIDTNAPGTPARPTLAAGSDTGVSSTDGITSDATPTFTGTAEVGSTVTLYDGATAVGTATVDANGAYTVTASNLADGTHALHTTATDAAGNVSASSGNVSVIIDTSTPATPAAPTIDAASDTGASSTDGITSDTTPTFNGTAEVGSTVTLYDGTTAVGTATVGANGTYSVTASNLADGAHALSVTATNLAGNVSASSGTVNVVIDTSTPATPAAPTIDPASDTGASSTDGITSDTTPTFSGSAQVGSTITLYDGTTAVGTATVGANGTYSVTASNLADGAHALSVTATNTAGTVSTSSGAVNVVIDTSTPATPVAPTIDPASDTGASSTDGVTSDTTPTFSGSAQVGSTITLYDGTTAVGTATVGANGTYSVTASNLADGAHALSVTATNTAGTVSTSSGAVNVVIDTSAPGRPAAPKLAAASDTGPSSTDRLTSDASPTFTGSAEVGSTVTLYDGTTQVGTATVGANGTYSVTASNLADGVHALSVTATDSAGNLSVKSGVVNVTIDTSSPVKPAAPTLAAASDTGASATDGITKDATPTFTGSAEVGSTVTLYDGTTQVGTAKVGANGTYAVTASNLADGAHTLHITATDAAGNVSANSGNTSIKIDTAAPSAPSTPTVVASSDSGASSTDGITKVATPVVRGTADAGSIVTLYEGTKVVGSAIANSGGSYTIKPTALADGAHSLTAKATDAAGNVSSASGSVSVVVDRSAPRPPSMPTLTAASDSGASSRDKITNDTNPTLSGTAEAGSRVTLYDGSGIVGSALADANGRYAITSTSLSNGEHRLHAIARDAAGNVSRSSTSQRIVVDTVAPSAPSVPKILASFDSGASRTDSLTKVAAPVVRGTAEVGSTVTLYDGIKVVGSAKVNSSGNYTIRPTALAEGTHSLTAKATDAAGNVSSASGSVEVVIDRSAPRPPSMPTLTTASDSGASSRDKITSDFTPTLSGTAEAGSTVTVYDGSRIVGSGLTDGNGRYTITSVALSDGAHRFQAIARDAAGNVSRSSTSQRVVIDTAAPAAPSTPKLLAGFDTGASLTDGITKVAAPVVRGTAEAGSTVTLYDGTNVVGSAKANSSGVYTIRSSALADGTHSLSVSATDVAGNVGLASGPRNVTIDTTAPAVAIDSSGGSVTSATQTIAGTGEAGSTVKLANNGKAIGQSVVVGSNGTWSQKITLSSGTNNIVATDTDRAGNAGTSQAATYTYTPAASAGASSLNNMVQAMSTMTPSSSASMTPTASGPSAEAHPLAAAH